MVKTPSVWQEINLEPWNISSKIKLSLVSFFHTYVGTSLKELHITTMDNCLLRYLSGFCPNLRMLELCGGSFRLCNFALLPPSLKCLLINYIGAEGKYPRNWYTSFTPEHFPHLDRLEIEQAPEVEHAITQIATLKTLRYLAFGPVNSGMSSSAFTALLKMTDLTCLWLQRVDVLPENFIPGIVDNLRKLKQLGVRSDYYNQNLLSADHVKMLSQLPYLENFTLSIISSDVMRALCEVIPSMPRLKELAFYVSPLDTYDEDCYDWLENLKKCRPDVVLFYQGFEYTVLD